MTYHLGRGPGKQAQGSLGWEFLGPHPLTKAHIFHKTISIQPSSHTPQNEIHSAKLTHSTKPYPLTQAHTLHKTISTQPSSHTPQIPDCSSATCWASEILDDLPSRERPWEAGPGLFRLGILGSSQRREVAVM